MRSFRSILWIGPSASLVTTGVSDAPTLDLTWVKDTDEALTLPPASFDALVLTGDDLEQLHADVRRLRRKPGLAPVLVCLPEASNGEMRSLLAAGATDMLVIHNFAERAGLLDELLDRLDRLAEAQPWSGSRPSPVPSDDQSCVFPGIVGTSRAIREVFALVKCAMDSTATVLLVGETGSGKEVIARALHDGGPRRQNAFVAVNCAAFPESLLESELFGYVKGAFTGAERDKRGLFEAANGGTLFLDEVGELSAPFQAKLLRVLQEREVRPVGGAKNRPVDVRVVAATNRDLRHDAEAGHYREDLYYRLAVFPIAVPALRQRQEDITPLAEHFLALHGRRERKENCRLSHAAIHLLHAYRWPGNVRELENEMQRVLTLARPGELITPRLLSNRVLDILEAINANVRPGDSLREMVDRFQGWVIRRTLDANRGRKARTAEALGITREGLYKKMKRLNVE